MDFSRRKFSIEPAAPAIVMAFGIFFIGAFDYFSFLNRNDTFFVLLYSVITIIVLFMVIFTYSEVSKMKELMKQPVRSFALGTWIAALSVFCIVIKMYTENVLPWLQFLTIVNIVFLSCFLFMYVRSFIYLCTTHKTMKVDGIVLLSTVSIQSGVLMLYHMFGSFIFPIFPWVIGLGLVCYMVGFVLIIRSYTKMNWTLADDWANTNCIIHGALSIAGLAMVMTNAFSFHITFIVWGVTVIFFLFIEGMECVRAWKRYKRYHLRHGLFSYHVTQWSRNFTFGMFFAFTYTMYERGYFHSYDSVANFIAVFLKIWAVVVLCLLIIQTLLFLHGKSFTFLKRKVLQWMK